MYKSGGRLTLAEGPKARGKFSLVLGGTVGNCQANIAEVVGGLQVVGGFAYFLYGAHHQAHQHGNDGDHHQQFDECEATAWPVCVSGHELNPP